MGFEVGLKHGYGVYEWADGRVYKGKWTENKMHKEGTFIGPMTESIKESGKTQKQHGFSNTAMQNSKSRFLHGLNGLPNKANEKSSRGLHSCPNTGKTACQTV